MAIRVSIPRHLVYSVILDRITNRRNTLLDPAKAWLKKNQIDEITGYTLVYHDNAWYIDFANRNDAIRFRLVMTGWPTPPPPFEAGAFYAPYVPLQITKITQSGQQILRMTMNKLKVSTDDTDNLTP